MIPYVLTQFAEQDLIDIWDHIALDNLDAADRVHKLAKTPRIGHFREDLADRRQRFFLVFS